MDAFAKTLFPEIILTIVAAILFLLGTSRNPASRRLAPVLAIVALVAAFISQLGVVFNAHGAVGPNGGLEISDFSRYIKLLASVIGILLTLLAWPTNSDGTGGKAVHFGTECGEFFGLLLLSLVGLFLIASANDMMTLFLGIELSSLPTYIMVSISRPTPVAQEAGVKYFFLGALAAALMLFGFSYLYGTTGTVYLHGGDTFLGVDNVISAQNGGGTARTMLTSWQTLALVILISGFAFKMLAVPMHFYAGDVYQGAATPVTALLSFVPKTGGFVALIKVIYVMSNGAWMLPLEIGKLLAWLAILTMCAGNILGLLQQNIKRILAYSSISHTGYMLVGVTALVTSRAASQGALRGITFYLMAYGLTNIAAFGVLALLPAKGGDEPGSSAETFDDIAGLGRQHVGLGLAMSVACFSLIGIPLTVGFMGKVLLIEPALQANLVKLVVILVINSAISAGYYLRIVAALFLRPAAGTAPSVGRAPLPILASIAASVLAVIALGAGVPLTNLMIARAARAADLNPASVQPAASTVTLAR